jgi:predicted MFS family arabinose efflux permease
MAVTDASTDVRNYALVTGAYWGFTLSDGALRMLVLLHFYTLGYGPFEIAMLFLLYEFFGIVTNLIGGWVGARLGLKVTLFSGLALQIAALVMLGVLDPAWGTVLSVAYVMAAQALSGIAKDLTKMSSKSAVKLLVPAGAEGALFRWVALLTGSKNALKGGGFFLGGVLLATFGFRDALFAMAAVLALVLLLTVLSLPGAMGRAEAKTKLSRILSKSKPINRLSAARFFLFGARDIWFVVGLPVFLAAELELSHVEIGSYLAAWVIGYGMVQAAAPGLLRSSTGAPQGGTARTVLLALIATTAAIALATGAKLNPALTVMLGLAIFGVIFALNSAVHSYLILAYTERDEAALNVGFYYMANAAGRLAGTLGSGLAYQAGGFGACLWTSAAFLVLAYLFSLGLPSRRPAG